MSIRRYHRLEIQNLARFIAVLNSVCQAGGFVEFFSSKR